MMKQKEVTKALTIINNALISDEQYFIAWQANIAMAFVDNMGWFKRKTQKRCVSNSDVHRVANDAANAFIEQLTGVRIKDMIWSQDKGNGTI